MSFDFWNALPSLRTERLLLRSVKMSDAQDLYETCRDPLVARYVLWDAHRSVSETKSYIRYLHKQYRMEEPPTFAIVLREEQKVVGTISFIWIEKANASCEVGYSLNRLYWHRGIAAEALKAILRYAFYDLHLNRVEAQHDLRNPESGRVMLKAGMQREGILRKRVWNKGRFIDVALYSILKEEFHP